MMAKYPIANSAAREVESIAFACITCSSGLASQKKGSTHQALSDAALERTPLLIDGLTENRLMSYRVLMKASAAFSFDLVCVPIN